MKFQLKDYNRNASDQELLDDLKRIANQLEPQKLSSKIYEENGGKYDSSTMHRRFGSWNNALKRAGLDLFRQHNASTEELLENIEKIWINLGKQPGERDMNRSVSQYSIRPYITKFGTWRKALEAFIEYINSDDDNSNEPIIEEETQEKEKEFKHKTKRFPNERLKVQVLIRDGNKCALCGITVTGKSIHFDHIKPWSKGGETELENLQVLCETHNLAKGNLDYPGK